MRSISTTRTARESTYKDRKLQFTIVKVKSITNADSTLIFFASLTGFLAMAPSSATLRIIIQQYTKTIPCQNRVDMV